MPKPKINVGKSRNSTAGSSSTSSNGFSRSISIPTRSFTPGRRLPRDELGKVYSFRNIDKEVSLVKAKYADKPTQCMELPTDNLRRCAVRFGIHGGEADLKTMIHKDLDTRQDSWHDVEDVDILHSVAKSEIKNKHYNSALKILKRVRYTYFHL